MCKNNIIKVGMWMNRYNCTGISITRQDGSERVYDLSTKRFRDIQYWLNENYQIRSAWMPEGGFKLLVTYVPEFKLTEDQRTSYIRFVHEHGQDREYHQGRKDAVAFLAGAMCLFFWMKDQGRIPGSWVFGPLSDWLPWDDDIKTIKLGEPFKSRGYDWVVDAGILYFVNDDGTWHEIRIASYNTEEAIKNDSQIEVHITMRDYYDAVDLLTCL